MAVVKALLVPNTSQSEAARLFGVNRTRIVQAHAVMDYAEEKTDSVLLGFLSLDEAYGEARARKGAASSKEAQMGRLRAEVPDTATRAGEGAGDEGPPAGKERRRVGVVTRRL